MLNPPPLHQGYRHVLQGLSCTPPCSPKESTCGVGLSGFGFFASFPVSLSFCLLMALWYSRARHLSHASIHPSSGHSSTRNRCSSNPLKSRGVNDHLACLSRYHFRRRSRSSASCEQAVPSTVTQSPGLLTHLHKLPTRSVVPAAKAAAAICPIVIATGPAESTIAISTTASECVLGCEEVWYF